MGFSQHQSFYFRDKWLEKVFDYLGKNSDENKAFDISNYYKLGVGKNMFDSIKFWIKAFNITDNSYKLSNFGLILSQTDPLLLNINSISLMHYFLVTNKKEAPFWFWFYNEFSFSYLYKDEISQQDGILGWAQSNFNRISINSIKKDLLCFIQMYTAKENIDDPEDSMFSPFYKLNLIKDNNVIVFKNNNSYESIGIVALVYSLYHQMKVRQLISISVDQILQESGFWGKVFLLDKSNIIKALNEIKFKYKNLITFDQSSKIDLVTLKNTDIETFLKHELGNYHG